MKLRIVYITLGTISLTLGVIGIFLPLLPTTPFLLFTATLYFRSSQKLYNWLINHKHLGPYIKNFLVYKAIPLKVKITSIALLWITIGYSIFFAVKTLWVQVLLFVIAVGVTIHILSYKTLK